MTKEITKLVESYQGCKEGSPEALLANALVATHNEVTTLQNNFAELLDLFDRILEKLNGS